MEVTTKEDGSVNTETIVKYYYVHNSEGVIERHIDVKTNEVLEEVKHEGSERTEYSTSPREFEGYDLIEEPEKAEGEMRKEEIVVEYKYIRKAKVEVEYIDKFTGEKILEVIEENNNEEENVDNTNNFKDSTIIIEGHEDDKYETKAKEFENYKLVEVPENAEGEMKVERKEDGTVEVTTKVRYYYVHISEGVVEKHIDVMTDEEIEKATIYEGYEGESYETKAKEIEGYDIVEEKLPENAQGKMRKEKQEVRYYYVRKASVRVQYIEKETEKKLEEDIVINGHEKERYETEEKKIEGYKLVEKPENFEGEMKVIRKDGKVETEQVVTYKYSKVKDPSTEKPDDNKPNNGNNNNNNNNSNNGGNANNPNGSNGNNNLGNNGANSNNGNTNSNGTTNNGGNNEKPTVIEKVYNYIVKDKNDGNGNKETTTLLTPGTGDMLPQIVVLVIIVVIVVNIIVIQIRKRKNTKENKQ